MDKTRGLVSRKEEGFLMEILIIIFVCICPFYGAMGGALAAKRNVKKFRNVMVWAYLWPFFLLKEFKDILKTDIEMDY